MPAKVEVALEKVAEGEAAQLDGADGEGAQE